MLIGVEGDSYGGDSDDGWDLRGGNIAHCENVRVRINIDKNFSGFFMLLLKKNDINSLYFSL